MQDYKRFISEINHIEVSSKQLFVNKDGAILYDAPVNIYLEKDPKQERWPGHLSTFYDFDKYNTDNDVSPHESQLANLRDLALIDLLILPSEQLARFLADLRAKRDRMNRLAKIALDLQKEHMRQVFDNALSLEYNLFEAFKIPQTVGVSLEVSSARHLWQAVTVKRNELFTIVKQIERAVNPEAIDEEGPENKSESGEKKSPLLLFLNPESKQDVYSRLKRFITPDADGEYLALYSLIFNNQAPETPIIITGSVQDFGLTFYNANAVLPRGASTLTHQLTKYFERNDGKTIISLKESILVKHINGMGARKA